MADCPSEDALSELLKTCTLSDEHAASSAGERALSVFVNHTMDRSAGLHRKIEALRRYVPNEIRYEDDLCTRFKDLASAERELCCSILQERSKLALVSREVRNTLQLYTRPTLVGQRRTAVAMALHPRLGVNAPLSDLPPPLLEHILLQAGYPYQHHRTYDQHTLVDKITISLQELLGDMLVTYGCHEDFRRPYDPSDEQSPQSSRYFSWQENLIADSFMDADGQHDLMRSHAAWLCGALKCELARFRFQNDPGFDDCAFLTVSELLCMLDVLPHLEQPTDETLKHELYIQCSDIAQLAYEYCDSGVSVDELDTFMGSVILLDENVFTEDRFPEAWNERAL